MNFIDLHTHTNKSDGFLSPLDLLKKAKEYDLRAVAICDHDTLSAYDDKEIFDFAFNLNIELVSGIEFSTEDENKRKYHILGLLIDLSDKELNNLVKDIQYQRVKYAEDVRVLLARDGWFLDLSDHIKRKESITKAHISRGVLGNKLNEEKLKSFFGKIPTEGEFTESFLIKNKPYYLNSKNKLSPKVAIDIIHKAKGVAILAHPAFNVMNGENLKELCFRFKNLGIDGFEAINIQYNKSMGDVRVDMVFDFAKFAEDNGMLITGGSDYHHSDKKLMGNFVDLGFKNDNYKVGYEILEKLKIFKDKKYGK